MTLDLIKQQILEATRAVVPSERVCVYTVDSNGTPHDHLSTASDPHWEIYPRFRDVDPFHPRHFAQLTQNVFLTHEGRGSRSDHEAFIQGFRQPMGIRYKAEVFLRTPTGDIIGGVRFSRAAHEHNFQANEIDALTRLQPIFSQAWQAVLPNPQTEALDALTKRELEVFQALQNGLSDKVIGRELAIALPTVKTHVKSILRKLQSNSRAELIARFPRR